MPHYFDGFVADAVDRTGGVASRAERLRVDRTAGLDGLDGLIVPVVALAEGIRAAVATGRGAWDAVTEGWGFGVAGVAAVVAVTLGIGAVGCWPPCWPGRSAGARHA